MLEENRQALANVERALSSQPENRNEELLKLKKELEEVINVTEELVVPARSEPQEVGTGAELAETSRTDAASKATPETSNQTFQSIVGRTCVFEAHGNKVYGRVQKFSKREGKGERIIVQVVGASSDDNLSSAKHMEVDLRAVRLLVPPSVSLLEKGARGQAIWTEDGVWYECVIIDTFESRQGGQMQVRVKFTEYGNEDVVPIDRVRLFGPTGGAPASAQKRKIKEITTPGGYKIPEPLQIKPTDSEHQKQLKKKKIGLLKKQQRQDSAETEARQRASAWQKHFTGGKSKSKVVKRTPPRVGSSTCSSIFSTSNLPEGKVGVTNSGRGMTSFRTRQKHVYDADDDEEGEEDDGGEEGVDVDDDSEDGEGEEVEEVEDAEDAEDAKDADSEKDDDKNEDKDDKNEEKED